jgi:hypothetical protein
MNRNQDWAAILGTGFILGLFAMGFTKQFLGSNPDAKTWKLKDACELNIPRNQQCVMQFIPESKK